MIGLHIEQLDVDSFEITVAGASKLLTRSEVIALLIEYAAMLLENERSTDVSDESSLS